MIDKLEFLIALARERHFGRAAEASGVTQPTLSAAIRSLEEGFGVVLVNRGSRFIGFTPEGERVLEWARRIVSDTRAMRQEVTALREGLSGHLKIACIPSAAGFVPLLTAPYRIHHPAVRFSVVSKSSEEIIALIENLQVDAGLTYVDNEPLGRVRAVPLFQERYRLVTAAGGAFEGREAVTWAEAAQVPLCLMTPDMQNRRIIESLLRNAGSAPEPVLESNSVIVLIAHVRSGGWSTILPEQTVATMIRDDRLVAIPIVEPQIVHTIGVVVPNRDPPAPLAAALVAEARRLAEGGLSVEGREVVVGAA